MLYLIATPIGDKSEITIRSLELLGKIETLIVESTKEASKLLKNYNLSGKKYFVLNEHTPESEISELVDLCRTNDVALMSDCGTPGFCDPGSNLVYACRRSGISVKSSLGASALMGILSLSGVKLDQFVFRGFLPAENSARDKALEQLTREFRAIILMDTPYRLQKLLFEMESHFKDRRFLLAVNLSQETEQILEGSIEKIRKTLIVEKAEFMLLIYPRGIVAR